MILKYIDIMKKNDKNNLSTEQIIFNEINDRIYKKFNY